MAILINNPNDAFNSIQVIEFRYQKPLKQRPKGTLFIRYQRIHFDEDGNKSWCDDSIKELFLKDVDDFIFTKLGDGEISLFNAFEYLQIAISDLIDEKTGLDTEYVSEV